MKKLTLQNKVISVILGIVVGGVFVASAVLKLLSIETFDLYIYEHQLFSISVVETLTRLLIAVEFTIGVLLIIGLERKFAYWTAMLMLVGFTIYLIVLPYIFHVDINNCHCFGEQLVLNRTQSIAKNLILLCLLIPINTDYGIKWKKSPVIVAVLGVVVVTLVMVINAPNYLYTLIYGNQQKINAELYQTALKNTDKYDEFTQGKQIICMYSTACGYCKKSVKKVHAMMQREQIPQDKVKVIFWRAETDEPMHKFFREQKVTPLAYTTFTVDTFLNITEGKMPVILFSDEGNIVQTMSYTTLQEKDILHFLQ